jgi:hypothetical protein
MRSVERSLGNRSRGPTSLAVDVVRSKTAIEGSDPSMAVSMYGAAGDVG